MIRVLGVCASPRKHGNSAFLLDEALRGAREAAPDEVSTHVFGFAGKSIAHCKACDACSRNGGICTTDDDFQELCDLFVAADAIVYSVPIYHMGCPSMLRAFFDRTTCLLFRFGNEPDEPMAQKMLKPVGALVQGNGFASGQEQTALQVTVHSLMMGNIPIVGDDWEASLGAAGWTGWDVDKDAIKRLAAEGDRIAEASVRASYSVGRSCVQMAQLLLAGVAARDDVLAGEEIYDVLRNRVAGRQPGPWPGAAPVGGQSGEQRAGGKPVAGGTLAGGPSSRGSSGEESPAEPSASAAGDGPGVV
jgi:multimeric flavodoxin WrbA